MDDCFQYSFIFVIFNYTILRKYFIMDVFIGKNVEVAGTVVNTSNHPQGLPFCMDLLAKKFVLQGDLMISGNPEAAFSYAAVIIALWNRNPNFGK